MRFDSFWIESQHFYSDTFTQNYIFILHIISMQKHMNLNHVYFTGVTMREDDSVCFQTALTVLIRDGARCGSCDILLSSVWTQLKCFTVRIMFSVSLKNCKMSVKQIWNKPSKINGNFHKIKKNKTYRKFIYFFLNIIGQKDIYSVVFHIFLFNLLSYSVMFYYLTVF